MTSGPVTSSMVVYEDLLNYETGIYYHKEGTIIGAHAILIVGWGETAEGTKYWELQNSWGQDWGYDGGFFKVKIGESQVASELFGGAFTCEPKLVQEKSFFNFLS